MSGYQSRYPLEIHLFGTWEVRLHDQPLPPLRSRKERWLLALLVLHQDREMARDWIASTLWPDNEESQALLYLRNSLFHLRQALGSEAHRLLSPTSRTLRLDLTSAFCDVLAFDNAIQKGREEAVALYRGPLLPDCLEEWALTERNRCEQAYLSALERLAEINREQGETAGAVRWLRMLVAADAYRESAVCSLMQTLSDSGDRAAMQQVYQELRLRLHGELNITPAPETQALFKRLGQREVQPGGLPAMPASAPPSLRHLPIPLTDLIGRELEIAEVTGWLQRVRLVTLLGPGGVGKTRLAIAAAEAALRQFPDGVWFVDLAPLQDASRVADTAARALAIPEQPNRTPEERLIEALTARSLALVLDNCEHVQQASADLAYQLLSACSGLRILATSRHILGIAGEQVYPVPSLALPPPEVTEIRAGLSIAEKDPTSLLDYEGIRLFVQCAVQVDPTFRLDRRNGTAVAAICQHLDGIPLAIEMAAVRVKSLSVAQIVVRLEDRFQILTGGSRAALPRQRTLQAAIDWSHDLLGEAERILFRRLSVFARGFSLEAAEVVCAGGGITEGEVLDVLTQLVEKSLVVFEELGAGTTYFRLLESMQEDDEECLKEAEETRYRLLGTVRQYAQERLQESGEGIAVHGRHRDYFTAFAEEAEQKLASSEQLEWSHWLELEHDNIRRAIAWCRDDPEGVEAGLHLTSVMGWFWATHGYLNEGQQHLAEALARDGLARTKVRAEALNNAAMLACHRVDYAAASILYEECLAIRRELSDESGINEALTALGLIKRQQGDQATALAYLEERLALQQAVGDRQNSANMIYWLGCIAEEQGDLPKARAYLEEAHTIDLEFGQRAGHAQWKLGDVLCMQGDYEEARTLLTESLKAGWELDDKLVTMSSLEYLAWLSHSQGQSEQATRLYGAADVLRTTFGYIFPPSDQNTHVTRTEAVRAALDDAAFTTAWEQGRAMSLEQMVQYAGS